MLFLVSVAVAIVGGAATRWLLVHARSLLMRRSRRHVLVVVGVSAALGVLGSASPTGNVVLDPLYRAVLAGAVALAASRARRWTWIVAAGATVIADHGSPVGIAAGAALGLALGSADSRRPGRGVGAVIGLGVAQGLLHTRWAHPLGASATLTAAVLGMLTVSHLRRLRRADRRRAWTGIGLVMGAAAAACAAYAGGLYHVRQDVRGGLADAEAALAAAQAGNPTRSSAQLAAAAGALANVQADTQAWWDVPARAVPIVAQNVRALTVGVTQARAVLARSSTLVHAADARDLQIRDGTVNLARVAALTPAVRSSETTLSAAAAAMAAQDSPWLLDPVRARLHHLAGKIDRTASAESTLALATADLPELLGRTGTRRWLLAVLDNSELRGAGGFMPVVGELDASGGHFSLGTLQPVGELTRPPGGAHITGPAPWLARYGGFHPELYIGDDVYSPDFPSDAEVLSQVYPQWGGHQVDGVIGVDPFGLAALLRLTGPVSVPSWPVPITADNAVPILLHDEYLRFGTSPDRNQFLVDLGHRIFHQLTTGTLPKPDVLARTLGPALAGRHVQIYSPHPSEERLFDRIDASGAMPVAGGDFLQVVTQNASNTKGDWYLTRSMSYDARVDPATGVDQSELSLALHNSAPSSGEPEYVLGGRITPPGYDRQWISIYSPLGLSGATLDGRPVTLQRELGLGSGRYVYSVFVSVAPGVTDTLRVRLYGVVPDPPAYDLEVGYQPASHPDTLRVRVELPGRRAQQWTVQQTRPATFSVR